MKKVFLIISVFCFIHSCFSQKELQRAIHNYYRYDPFERSFSNFLNSLLSDTALINKTVVKRTDSTLFFFKGEYKGRSPFGFKATRTEVRLAELEIEIRDSVFKKDTILAYQLVGYITKASHGMQAVKAEFEKFNRKYGGDFSNKITKDLADEKKIEGATRNYFLVTAAISPLTVVWGNINADESIFAITVRFIKIENKATLAGSYFPVLPSLDVQFPDF